jgi:PA14 domain-containing protein/dolichyl-phosphate-mannose-protein mannosyltransferase
MAQMRTRSVIGWSIFVAITLAAAYAFLTWQLKADVGVTQTLFRGIGEDRKPLVERRTTNIDVSILGEDPHLPRRSFTVHWAGVLRVPRFDYYVFDVAGQGRVTLTIDRDLIQRHTVAVPARPRVVALDKGFHDVEIEYEHLDGTPAVAIRWAPAGSALTPLAHDGLFVSNPEHPRLRSVLGGIRRTVRGVGIGGLIVVGWLVLLRVLSPVRAQLARRIASPALTRGDVVAAAMAAAIAVVGSWLRFETLAQQDVAIGLAWPAFSILAILATFLLGSYAFSCPVGLGAALGMALRGGILTNGTGGWRDEAFTCAVVLFAYTIVRFARAPSKSNAVWTGLVAGLACLVRFTSLSFVVPAFAFALVPARTAWRQRLIGVGLAVIVAALVAGPYLFSNWHAREAQQPINAHADAYRAAASDASVHPFRTLDTFVLGMTSSPFANTRRVFDRWSPAIGHWLSVAAVVGLVLFLGSTAGRLLLLVLASSLVPHAFTWRIIPDAGLTNHADPFFFIAAGVALTEMVRLGTPAGLRRLASARPVLRSAIAWSLAVAILAAMAWLAVRVLPVMVVREAIRLNEPVTITSGDRDGWFFDCAWSRPFAEGTVTARISREPHSSVWLPLARVDDYALTIRIDPFPRPLEGATTTKTTLHVFMNEQAVARFEMAFNPERVGAYEVRLPRTVVKTGLNRLTFAPETVQSAPRLSEPARTTPAGHESANVRLWYVQVRAGRN